MVHFLIFSIMFSNFTIFFQWTLIFSYILCYSTVMFIVIPFICRPQVQKLHRPPENNSANLWQFSLQRFNSRYSILLLYISLIISLILIWPAKWSGSRARIIHVAIVNAQRTRNIRAQERGFCRLVPSCFCWSYTIIAAN